MSAIEVTTTITVLSLIVALGMLFSLKNGQGGVQG
jgi:hypothetical protein